MVKRELRSRNTLEDVEDRRIRLARLRRECRYLESRCTAATRNYTALRGGGSDPHSSLWDELADKRELLHMEEAALEHRLREVRDWIEQLPNPRWRLMLQCHYLEGMDLRDVLEELERATGRPFTMNQVYRIHRQALDAAENLWPM